MRADDRSIQVAPSWILLAVTSPRTGYPYLDEVVDRPGSVLAFAHRGGAYHPEIEGLENTLAAFEHAVALGYDYLETDVHVTRDGVLLAFHDAVLDRVTDRKGEIARLSYDEVRTAVIGGRAEIPTLAVLFDAFPDARFNIDIKSDGAVSVLADFLNAREAWDRVLVGSFSARRLQRFRRLVSRPVPTSATPVEVVLFRFLPLAAAGRSADAGLRRLPGAAPPRTAAGDHRRAGPTGSCRGQARPRLDHRQARRDARAARPRSRRTLHRSHRSAQGCPHRPGAVEWLRARETETTMTAPTDGPSGIADLSPLNRAEEQKRLVLLRLGQQRVLHDRPLGALRPVHHRRRRTRAGCADPDETCDKTVNLVGLHLAPGSLPLYLTSFATILSAFILPLVGAMVDRTSRKKDCIWRRSPGAGRSSPPCCSSCGARTGSSVPSASC